LNFKKIYVPRIQRKSRAIFILVFVSTEAMFLRGVSQNESRDS